MEVLAFVAVTLAGGYAGYHLAKLPLVILTGSAAAAIVLFHQTFVATASPGGALGMGLLLMMLAAPVIVFLFAMWATAIVIMMKLPEKIKKIEPPSWNSVQRFLFRKR